jgi:hypothetical protein
MHDGFFTQFAQAFAPDLIDPFLGTGRPSSRHEYNSGGGATEAI